MMAPTIYRLLTRLQNFISALIRRHDPDASDHGEEPDLGRPGSPALESAIETGDDPGAIWPDATPDERASWELWAQRSIVDPVATPPAAAYLPVTWREELSLVSELGRRIQRLEPTRDALLALFWELSLERARRPPPTAKGTPSSIVGHVNTRLKSDALAPLTRLFPGSPIAAIDVRELRGADDSIAAWWCLIRGHARRAGAGRSVLSEGAIFDLSTFLNGCESLGSLCDRAASLLTMWRESPDSAAQFTRAWIKSQEEFVWKRGHRA